MLKEGNDHFEVTHLEPKVDVCEKRYVVDADDAAADRQPAACAGAGRCGRAAASPAGACPGDTGRVRRFIGEVGRLLLESCAQDRDRRLGYDGKRAAAEAARDRGEERRA